MEDEQGTGEREILLSHSERDEPVPARKKSDSFSKARPVSTASVGSLRHDSVSSLRHGSVSKKAAAGIVSIAEGEGGEESQQQNEVPPQVWFEYLRYNMIVCVLAIDYMYIHHCIAQVATYNYSCMQ